MNLGMRKNILMICVAVLFLQSCTGQGSIVQGTGTPGAAAASETAPVPVSATPLVANTTTPTLQPSATITPTPLPTATPTPALLPWPVNGVEIAQGTSLDSLPGLGVYWVRRNALVWSSVETVQGYRNWEAAATLEQQLIQISEAGMQAILVVRGTPDWAQAVVGSYCSPIRAEYREAFASFLYEAVGRYSAPPYNVHYWELWNEPDVDPGLVSHTSPFGCWGDINDTEYYGGEGYADMLEVVYPRIKLADPQAQVLVGGLLMDCDPRTPVEDPPGSGQFKSCTPAKFLEGILASGGGDYFDGVSFHAYDFYNGALGQYSNFNWDSSWDSTGPTLLAKVDYLRELLTTYGHPDKFLMNTEVALLCGRTGTEDMCLGDDYANTKAYYAVQAHVAAHSVGVVANIWFSVEGWRGSALLDADSQPLPVYLAISNYAERLGVLAPLGKVDGFQDVSIYEFRGDGRTVWVAWSLDGLPYEISLPALPDAMYDVYGSSLSPSLQLTVTLAPVYIEWEERP